MTTIHDGIHYNRWARSRELDRALRVIAQALELDLQAWRADWRSDESHYRAAQTRQDLIDALVKSTGCDPTTARLHTGKLLKIKS